MRTADPRTDCSPSHRGRPPRRLATSTGLNFDRAIIRSSSRRTDAPDRPWPSITLRGDQLRPEEQPFTRQPRRWVRGARILEQFNRAPSRFPPIVKEISHCRRRGGVVESDARQPHPQMHITRCRQATIVGLSISAREGMPRHRLRAPAGWLPTRRIGARPALDRPSGTRHRWGGGQVQGGDGSRRCRSHEVSQSGVRVVPWSGILPNAIRQQIWLQCCSERSSNVSSTTSDPHSDGVNARRTRCTAHRRA